MKVEITLCDKARFKVKTPYSALLVDRFRITPGARYEPADKSWSFPAVRDVMLMVCDAVGLLPAMLPADVRAVMGPTALAPEVPVDMSLIQGHFFYTQPYEHQKVGLARLLGHNRWLTADEQGCGKSHIVCNRVRRFFLSDEEDEIVTVLILCPKSVVSVWREQLETHASLACTLVEGTTEQRTKQLRGPSRIKVANYEALLHTDGFSAIPWTAIVLDEVHRLKNYTAQTSRAVRKLTAKANYVWGLSGTPAPNGLEDWLGVLSAIDPGLLPVDTKTAFEARYCLKTRMGDGGPFVVSGYRNVEELHGYVRSITSRVTKAEALDLPPKVFSTRTVKLEGETARVYRELKKDAVARLSEEGQLTVRNILAESLRLLQVVGGFVPDDSGKMHELKDKPKMSALADALDEHDGQAVIWCAFLEEVEWISQFLQKEYGETVTLTGKLSSAERTLNIGQFQARQKKYLVGTAATGGAGITLHAADLEVYYSRNYNLANYLQSIDRLHRIGQTKTVNIVKLIALNTVDQKVDESLDKKESLQAMLLMKPEELF